MILAFKLLLLLRVVVEFKIKGAEVELLFPACCGLCVKLTRRLKAAERSSCCAHSWHSAEQCVWMEGGRLSISTRTYHSILHRVPARAHTNIKQFELFHVKCSRASRRADAFDRE